MNTKISDAARRLRDAISTGKPCAPVRDLIGETDLATAYAVQAINTGLLLESGARMVGRKIGLTSVAVQQQLGVDQPDYGALLNTMEVMNGGEVPWAELMQPKIEAEIALVLGKDLDMPAIGAADILSAVDFAVASLEIVGSRILNWDIRITDTIADNAAASHFVLGHRPVKLADFDIVGCKMAMEKNGQRVSEGTGAACMGSPVSAALWLARTMAALGHPLRAGDVVLTGALGPMTAVEPGDVVSATIEGLGSVSVRFGA